MLMQKYKNYIFRIGVLIICLLCMNSMISQAQPEYVEADSVYQMQKDDTLDKAKENALNDALRNAVERAGVYVESYSKVNNLKLTEDQIRIIAGNVIKVQEKNFTIDSNGEFVTIRCHVKTIIDTDTIDLKIALEHKKTKEENEKLNIKIKEAENKFMLLKKDYDNAKDDNEKLRLRNELLTVENDLGGLYKQNLSGKNVLEEIKKATKYPTNIGGIGTRISQDELVRNIESNLFNNGWKKYVMYNNSRWIYIRTLDESFIEVLDIPRNNDEGIQLMIGTNNEEKADKLYRVAYSELESFYGKPTDANYSNKIHRAKWEKKIQNNIFRFGVIQYEEDKLRYLGIYNTDKKFWIGIWKSSEEIEKLDMTNHTQYGIEETMRAVNHNRGTWYDEWGNERLVISNGQINGCDVVAGYDFAGGTLGSYGIYRIKENGGYRDLKLTRESSNMLVVDNKINLINTKKTQYKLSVNGIYLTMPVKEMFSKIGKPDTIKNDANENCFYMEYVNMGLKIYTVVDRVFSISMKNNGNWRFDDSGLNYLNKPSEFSRHYNLIPYTPTSYKASENEYLLFDSYPAQLILAPTGY